MAQKTITTVVRVEISAEEIEEILAGHFNLPSGYTLDWNYGQVFRGATMTHTKSETIPHAGGQL